MDTNVLVDRQIDDGLKLVSRLVSDGFDVTVAFWAKTREEGLWFLYVGLDGLDMTTNLGESYRRLYLSLSNLPDSPIALSDVKLIGSANPIAQAGLKVRKQLSRGMPVRSGAQLLGGLAVDEIYVYPPLGPMTPDEVMQKVVGLMSRRGAMPPSQVELHDGSTIAGVPCGVRTVGNGVQIDLLDPAGGSHSIPLDQIASIQ